MRGAHTDQHIQLQIHAGMPIHARTWCAHTHALLCPALLSPQVGAEVAAGSPVRYVFFVSFLEIYLEQVRDLGRAALMSQHNGGRVPRKDLEEWAKSNMDVMEDAQGQTSVKDLKYIEVGIDTHTHTHAYTHAWPFLRQRTYNLCCQRQTEQHRYRPASTHTHTHAHTHTHTDTHTHTHKALY